MTRTTPLRTDTGQILIIDRGWLAPGNDQPEPDEVPAPPTGTVTVVARLMPGEPLRNATQSASSGDLVGAWNALSEGIRNARAEMTDIAAADAQTAAFTEGLKTRLKEAGDAVASIQSLTRQQALQDEAVASAEKAYRFAQERYRAGLGNYLVVLSTESQVLAQRRLAVDLRARQLDTRLVLMKALGGGWTDDTAVLHTAAAH